jgi:acetyl/propionyl-CoA carboxylase alpha subunit
MHYRFQNHGQVFEVSIERQGYSPRGGHGPREGEAYRASVDGQIYELQVLDAQPGQLSLRFDGRPITLYWAVDGDRKWVTIDGCTFLLEKPAARPARLPDQPPGSEAVRAPMPAQVRAIQAVEGEVVEKGRTLLLLEAMKMEIRIKAPATGRLARLLVSEGQAVEKDQLLVEIEKE